MRNSKRSAGPFCRRGPVGEEHSFIASATSGAGKATGGLGSGSQGRLSTRNGSRRQRRGAHRRRRHAAGAVRLQASRPRRPQRPAERAATPAG